MEMIIITGMSGAGKTRVVNTMEDMGYYCVDNMPVKLMGKFCEIAIQSEDAFSKMVMVVDSRGGKAFETFHKELLVLKNQGVNYKLLFLDCADNVLITRYKETRRKHPLYDKKTPSIEGAISLERHMLEKVREISDYIIDTTYFDTKQLKEKIVNIFQEGVSNKMLINCMSFGFKHGPAIEADLMFDVRCLPNPFYIKDLKHKTGIQSEVSEYVMSWTQAQELYAKIQDMIDFLLPMYEQEGKTQLVIAFGCTGGKHRSVTFAEKLCKYLVDGDNNVTVNHRDISK